MSLHIAEVSRVLRSRLPTSYSEFRSSTSYYKHAVATPISLLDCTLSVREVYIFMVLDHCLAFRLRTTASIATTARDLIGDLIEPLLQERAFGSHYWFANILPMD